MSTITTTTHASKWGFHPCTREECLKLKEAHLVLLRALRDIKRYERWNNKLEPEGEEPVCPHFASIYRYYYRSQKAKDEGRMTYGLTLGTNCWPTGHKAEIQYYEYVMDQYRNARRPKATAEEVQAMSLPEGFWELVKKLKGFYDVNPSFG
jgi:hypothetical protein